MNIEINNIKKPFTKILSFLNKYRLEIFIIFTCLIFGYMIMKISFYSTQEPTQNAINEKIKTVKLPKIDENAVKNIEQLEDQNIEVQSLFNEARNNPFSE